jgi:hypothetical protein
MAWHRLRRPSGLAALWLAGTVCAYTGKVSAREVERDVEAGVLIGIGTETTTRPVGRGDVNVWWAPHPSFQLGLQMGSGMTVLSYRCEGGCSGVTTRLTLLPGLLFGSRLFVTPSIALRASVGMTFLFVVSDGGGEFSPPFPTEGLAVDIKFGTTAPWGLRAGIAYIHSPYGFDIGLLMPTLALVWN